MAQLSRTTKCRGCGAEIAFIKTMKGKSMPVDPEPIYFIPRADFDRFVMIDGTVEEGQAAEMTAEGKASACTKIGYRSHFSTCPEARRFSHRKNKSERTREG